MNWQQRQLTSAVITSCQQGEKAEELVKNWMADNQLAINRWNTVLAEFKIGTTREFAKFSVALRELMLLNLNCTPTA